MEEKDALEWQRDKTGTIEQVRYIMVSDLDGGVFPSAKHGAKAAGYHLQSAPAAQKGSFAPGI